MGLFSPKRRLEQIQKELEETPLGLDRIALIERGIAEATRLSDPEAGFDLRENLLTSCMLIGRLDRCIPAMEWCLARCDAEPDQFDAARVLWQYKWIIAELPRHSHYSRQTIDRGIEDLAARFERAGWGPRAAALLRLSTALTMADQEEAHVHFERWSSLPRDHGSDCEACDVGNEVRYRLAADDFDGAIRAADPLLDGQLKCEEEPAITLSRLPFAYVGAERFDDALETAKVAIDLILDGHQYCEARGRVMHLLLMSGNVEPAGRLLEVSLPQALHAGNDLSLLQTCVIGVALVDAARARGIDVPTPDDLPPQAGATTEALRDWMADQAETLAPRFDARNGNSYYSDFWSAFKDFGTNLPDAN
ncbi:MAG: hypothetical protein JNM80_08560 [Phycisphaerae bacterium]|nr:hypothetical protein [Phycisphaerae bacterium]